MLSKILIHCVRFEYAEGYFWSLLFCFSVELKGLFYVCGNGVRWIWQMESIPLFLSIMLEDNYNNNRSLSVGQTSTRNWKSLTKLPAGITGLVLLNNGPISKMAVPISHLGTKTWDNRIKVTRQNSRKKEKLNFSVTCQHCWQCHWDLSQQGSWTQAIVPYVKIKLDWLIHKDESED